MSEQQDNINIDSGSSSSSDSEDEFLTITSSNTNKHPEGYNNNNNNNNNNNSNTYDREAMVRKKLLENFYGKSTMIQQQQQPQYDINTAKNTTPSSSTMAQGSHTPLSSRSRNASHLNSSNMKMGITDTAAAAAASTTVLGKDDLDSSNFDAKQYATKHIQSSSTQELLEMEEKLALSVRTLDSTMQTLVYENYSRFIDATDAIRSIGINVQANEMGLTKLTECMVTIHERSCAMEEALGTLRDEVAEKIRVRRLLTRLDTLLNLPATLHDQITAGKYRTATKNYLSAASILSKHSQGFESLKKIETECSTILQILQQELEHKLMHWSGRFSGLESYSDDAILVDGFKSDNGNDTNSGITDNPNPPKNMIEVFEVAGALFILHHAKAPLRMENATETDTKTVLSLEDLCSMAVAAAMRLLDRMLDKHMIEAQEYRFSGMKIGPDSVEDSATMRSLNEMPVEPENRLVPTEFLDSVLEGATLYGLSFGGVKKATNIIAHDTVGSEINRSARGKGNTEVVSYYLLEFVQEAFSSFLAHVRSILLEESIQARRDDSMASDENLVNREATHREIADALVVLVERVRELASGLALPEVGICPDFAVKLVDQAKDLTESMVRRRVDQKFHDLRLSVVKDCLVPFAHRAVEEREKAIQDGSNAFPLIVQIASSSLSDCLQLVDDTIRSIFADSSASSGDIPDLKDAVYGSTHRFVSWLANAFEILAGGEPTDSYCLAEAPLLTEEEEEDLNDGRRNEAIEAYALHPVRSDIYNDLGDLSDKEIVDLLDTVREHLIDGSNNDGILHSDFTLAIVELCRVSEQSVAENLEQSIASHLGDGKKKSRGIFPTGDTASEGRVQGQDGEISRRFKMAASRVLVKYAKNSGMNAAGLLCRDMADTSSMAGTEIPEKPSASALNVLSIAKTTALDCANIFEGPSRGGPVPKWDENISMGLVSTPMLGRKSGLQMDIERMFKEKVVIYPHPSEQFDATRDAVLFLFFRIVFRAMFENARLYKFSSGGYQQMQVDTMFFKHMIPHYISKDYTEHSTNACSALLTLLQDFMEVVEQRCTGEGCFQNDELRREASNIVHAFVDEMESDVALASTFVLPAM